MIILSSLIDTMGFFSALAKSFVGAYGKSSSQSALSGIVLKIKFWFLFTVVFLCIYHVVYLAQCTKPSGGGGTCIVNSNNGGSNVFKLDLSSLSTGGECGVGDPYDISGQTVDWVDTGFETNGKQLIVYVDGEYFPWGKEQTQKVQGYHIVTTRLDDGTTTDTLLSTEDYKECELNTDIDYSETDDQETRIAYENHFNSYTSRNANNRRASGGKLLEELGLQGDCIIGNNCNVDTTNEIQTACVLKNGAGIYMKIGADAAISYHIKNYFVPEYEKICLSGGHCTYKYKTSNGGTVYNLIHVPFALPPVIYREGANSSKFIWDIRDNVLTNLQNIRDYDRETEYRFYTLVPKPEDEMCDGDLKQKINGICYKSEQKKLTLEQIQDVSCPVSSTTSINLPNELCAPQSGKRIYIKPADTCYEDNDGNISLTFASGAKEVQAKSLSYRNNGFHITWLQDIVSAIFEPFFGSQDDNYNIEDLLDDEVERYNKQDQTITVCRKGTKDEALYFSYNGIGGDWIIKTEKYGSQGLRIKDLYDVQTTETMDVSYKIETITENSDLNTNSVVKRCVVASIKDKYKSSKTIDDYTLEEVKSTTNSLIRLTNMEDGLFVQIRNAIMQTSVYHTIRIMIVLWFVFSFGLGFINKEKILSRVPLITSDWKRFLILMWCSDPNNYEFIDKFLWSALIYGSQSLSAGIFDAVSSVYGTSLEADEPMAFFDDVVSAITSKEIFIKLGAIATSGITFVMFMFLFPFIVSGIKDFVLIILGPIVCLGFTMFSVGNIIMFMPLYALISLFGGKDKNKFTVAMKTLISEFIHFAFALGFFGACVGFIYHYFLLMFDFKVCWLFKSPSFGFGGIISLLSEKYDWQICNSGSGEEAGIIDRFKILWKVTKATFTFTTVSSLLGKFSIKISEMLANVFAKGGGMFGLSAADGLSKSFGDMFTKAITKINERVNAKEDKKDEKSRPPRAPSPPEPMPPLQELPTEVNRPNEANEADEKLHKQHEDETVTEENKPEDSPKHEDRTSEDKDTVQRQETQVDDDGKTNDNTLDDTEEDMHKNTDNIKKEDNVEETNTTTIHKEEDDNNLNNEPEKAEPDVEEHITKKIIKKKKKKTPPDDDFNDDMDIADEGMHVSFDNDEINIDDETDGGGIRKPPNAFQAHKLSDMDGTHKPRIGGQHSNSVLRDDIHPMNNNDDAIKRPSVPNKQPDKNKNLNFTLSRKKPQVDNSKWTFAQMRDKNFVNNWIKAHSTDNNTDHDNVQFQSYIPEQNSQRPTNALLNSDTDKMLIQSNNPGVQSNDKMFIQGNKDMLLKAGNMGNNDIANDQNAKLAKDINNQEKTVAKLTQKVKNDEKLINALKENPSESNNKALEVMQQIQDMHNNKLKTEKGNLWNKKSKKNNS